MDPRFANYNVHLQAPDQYWVLDHHLRLLKEQPYLYHNPVIDELPINVPGIYTLGGGRQIGKTTLLKQWVARLLENKVPPQSIIFLSGELIDDHHALVDLLQTFTAEHKDEKYLYIIIDEVTYINGWDKGIKFLADAGYLENCIVVITGSDLTLMQSARMTFPGRRGRADKVDYHIYSLSFKEVVKLKKSIPKLEHWLAKPDAIKRDMMDLIYTEFSHYLAHGGYLTAINDVARDGQIAKATLKIYSDWIRGDVLKRGKQELYLKEILLAIIKRYNKQVSWHALTDALSIDSHKTVSDYCELLASMDALLIQPALLIDKLTAAPKKARKLSFTDPFIYHALKYWLLPTEQPYQQILVDTNSVEMSADLVESVVSNQYRRHYPTYYIKGKGEIDVAYINENQYWPIEVKWRNQLRASDLKLISQYPRARVFAKVWKKSEINSIPIEPLPLALLLEG